MKVINYKMPDSFFEDLDLVKAHLTRATGIECSQKAALVALLRQAANVVRNSGKLWEWEGKSSEWEA